VTGDQPTAPRSSPSPGERAGQEGSLDRRRHEGGSHGGWCRSGPSRTWPGHDAGFSRVDHSDMSPDRGLVRNRSDGRVLMVGDFAQPVESLVVLSEAVMVLPGSSGRAGHEGEGGDNAGDEERQTHECIRLPMICPSPTPLRENGSGAVAIPTMPQRRRRGALRTISIERPAGAAATTRRRQRRGSRTGWRRWRHEGGLPSPL
jgi:hypothetical protein